MQSNLMQRLRAQRARQTGQPDRQLFYLLRASGEALDIQVVLAGLEPNGHLVQPQPYSVQALHLLQPPSFIQDADLGVLEWLLTQPETHERNSRRAAPLSQSASDALQATGRARHAERSHQSIAWQCHEPAALWQWLEADTGEQTGRACWPAGSRWLSQSDLAWDDEQGLIRLLNWPSDETLCRWLRHGVTLGPEALSSAWEQLRLTLEPAGCPLPVKREVLRFHSECRAWLRLIQEQGANRLVPGWHYRTEQPAIVWRVPATDNASKASSSEALYHRAGEQLISVARDAEAEQVLLRAWHSRLEALGANEVTPLRWELPDAHHWQHLMTRELPLWRENGVLVDIETGFSQYWVQADKLEARVDLAEAGWFDLSPRLWIDGEVWDFLPLLQQLINHYGLSELLSVEEEGSLTLPLPDGRLLLLDVQRVRRWLGIWMDYLDQDTIIDTPLRVANVHISRLALLEDAADSQTGDPTLWERASAQASRPPANELALPPDFTATLRPYQVQGVAWLQHLYQLELGGILADDMGLGKTLQTIAHLCLVHQQGGLRPPALVVVPTSLLSNWQREFSRFAPHLRVALVHGGQRERVLTALHDWDVLITSYGTLLSDQAVWESQTLGVLVLDEAQTIRNASTRISQCVRTLTAQQRLCLTGTPVENHLGELWSLFEVVMPGLLGTQAAYRRSCFSGGKRSEAAQHNPRLPWLLTRVAPFMFRRRKSEVATELPDKTEVVVRIPLGDAQGALYERVRADALQQMSDSSADGNALLILNVLTRLRQVCCDPLLLGDERARDVRSAKRDYVGDMLSELVDEGRAVLVFSQFTRMLDLLAEDLNQQKIPFLLLTGKTAHRQALVDRFQAGEVQVFLISLKAGGSGLNLTRADTVIHYDPWWNQAAEQQASDRAHRIGQTRQVFVYKLIAEDTLEEKILELQASKQSVLDALNATAEATAQQWTGSTEQLRDLIKA